MNYRYKDSNINAYGDDVNVIHFKFGDMRKGWNFTEEFIDKYPNFVSEFTKYGNNEPSKFSDPLAVVGYIERYELPVELYSNMVDEYFADVDACKEWICAEYMGQDYSELYKFEDGEYIGLDG